jgi:hypothetical protein
MNYVDWTDAVFVLFGVKIDRFCFGVHVFCMASGWC